MTARTDTDIERLAERLLLTHLAGPERVTHPVLAEWLARVVGRGESAPLEEEQASAAMLAQAAAQGDAPLTGRALADALISGHAVCQQPDRVGTVWTLAERREAGHLHAAVYRLASALAYARRRGSDEGLIDAIVGYHQDMRYLTARSGSDWE